ncbi:MAG: Uroporphyrinogen decarboxylase (URO-D) [Lentisphaerae bacterium ADurb.Bin242]|nr:MAG: Uroporphyrinogen decarboxylase (URO-D) [Lentisphaerae bacterium ADurb.Bin242]
MNHDFDVRLLKDLLNPDQKHLITARDRQCRAWRREKLDIPLLLLNGRPTPAQAAIPEYDFRQVFTSPEKMLCREIRRVCAVGNARSDAVPSIRANLGTGILLACLGLEQETFPDKMPWLKEHLSKEEISRLTPDDIRPLGSFARGLEMMRFFRDVLGDALPVYVMDTQGPFDLAHLLLGDDLFLELYDDPPFVHHLLTFCTELGRRTHRWMKEAAGEPMTALHHSSVLYSDSFGIRICEDTTALLDEKHIREFAIPYSRELARGFGGAWVHYCGYNEALTNAVLEAPEFPVLNFGHIPGHEQAIDFSAVMEKFAAYGKVNFNGWPFLPGETVKEYLTRMRKYAARGVLAPWIFPDPEWSREGFGETADIKHFWEEPG